MLNFIGMLFHNPLGLKSEGAQELYPRTERLKEFRNLESSGSNLSTSNSIVVIPTYNECDNIANLIKKLQSLKESPDILIVDDDSPDGTSDIVRKLIQKNEGIYLLQRTGKRGLGSAYRDGFKFALRHGWEYICQMDADFSHDPQDVSRLLSCCVQGADVVIGSRYVKGGKIKGWPPKRWLLSRAANLYAQIITRSSIDDLTGGFKCFRREALEKIDLERVTSEGYVFQVEMNYWARKESLKIKQIPICFSDRQRGASKMGSQEAKEGFKQLLKLVLWH